jgi:hypothetical protein
MNKGKRYSPEFRERAVRLVEELQKEDHSAWSAMQRRTSNLPFIRACLRASNPVTAVPKQYSDDFAGLGIDLRLIC